RYGERAAGDQAYHACQCSHGERKADVLLGPTLISQIEREKRAEADLHVGHEEIRPVETASALVRYFPVAQLALPAMGRDEPTGAGMKVPQSRPNPAPQSRRARIRGLGGE